MGGLIAIDELIDVKVKEIGYHDLASWVRFETVVDIGGGHGIAE